MQPLVTTRVVSHIPTSSPSSSSSSSSSSSIGDDAANNNDSGSSGHTLVLNTDFLRRVAEYHAGVSRPIGRNHKQYSVNVSY